MLKLNGCSLREATYLLVQCSQFNKNVWFVVCKIYFVWKLPCTIEH